MPREFDPFRSRIRDVLLREWDPHNAERLEAAWGSYDDYVEPVAALIQSGADEQTLMDWLHEREKESLCFPSLGKERLRRVARLLRAVERSA